MSWFPKIPQGIGPFRKFNTLMVAVVTGCLLAQRFYRQSPEVVDPLETIITIAGCMLAIGVVTQLVFQRLRRKP